MRLALVLFLLAAAACARDDGAPDPAAQTLVPCDADAGAGDPLACPVAADADAPAAP